MTDEPWWKDSPDGYEVLDNFKNDDNDDTELAASYTPNNGIRIGISEPDEDRREYNLTPDEARKLGEALIRWAGARVRVSSASTPE